MKTIIFDKDFANKRIVVACQFNAPLNVVWDAFTNPTVMDKWFAPHPFKAVTRSMNFSNGGRWLYCMLSPEGEKFWSLAEFSNIHLRKSYEALDAFCDENGGINTELPRLMWRYTFAEAGGVTTVVASIAAPNEADLKKILDMGFEEGYKMALNQLRELLHG